MNDPVQGMTFADFTERLDRLGPDMADWPPGEAQSARKLLEVSPEAGRVLAAALQVQGALHELMLVDPGKPVWAPGPRLVVVSKPTLRRAAAWGSIALAASLMIGFVAGVALPDPDDADAADQVFVAVGDINGGDVL